MFQTRTKLSFSMTIDLIYTYGIDILEEKSRLENQVRKLDLETTIKVYSNQILIYQYELLDTYSSHSL